MFNENLKPEPKAKGAKPKPKLEIPRLWITKRQTAKREKYKTYKSRKVMKSLNIYIYIYIYVYMCRMLVLFFCLSNLLCWFYFPRWLVPPKSQSHSVWPPEGGSEGRGPAQRLESRAPTATAQTGSAAGRGCSWEASRWCWRVRPVVRGSRDEQPSSCSIGNEF